MNQFDDRNWDEATTSSKSLDANSVVNALKANVNDTGIDDAAFRAMVRNLIGAPKMSRDTYSGSQFDR